MKQMIHLIILTVLAKLKQNPNWSFYIHILKVDHTLKFQAVNVNVFWSRYQDCNKIDSLLRPLFVSPDVDLFGGTSPTSNLHFYTFLYLRPYSNNSQRFLYNDCP